MEIAMAHMMYPQKDVKLVAIAWKRREHVHTLHSGIS